MFPTHDATTTINCCGGTISVAASTVITAFWMFSPPFICRDLKRTNGFTPSFWMGVISAFAKFRRQLCSVTSSPSPLLFLHFISSTPSSSPLLYLLVFSPQHLWIYFGSSLTGHRNRRGTATAGHRNRRGTATDGAPRPTEHRNRRGTATDGALRPPGTVTDGHRDRRASRPTGTVGDRHGPKLYLFGGW